MKYITGVRFIYGYINKWNVCYLYRVSRALSWIGSRELSREFPETSDRVVVMETVGHGNVGEAALLRRRIRHLEIENISSAFSNMSQAQPDPLRAEEEINAEKNKEDAGPL